MMNNEMNLTCSLNTAYEIMDENYPDVLTYPTITNVIFLNRGVIVGNYIFKSKNLTINPRV